MNDNYVQVGLAVMRDPITGLPCKERVPLYARVDVNSFDSIINDDKMLTDIAGVFVDVLQSIHNQINEKEVKE